MDVLIFLGKSSLLFFLTLNFIKAESLIITNGENRLIIKKGEEIVIQYQNNDTIFSDTGKFWKINDDHIILKKFDGDYLVQEKDYGNVIVKTIRYFPIKIDINSIISIKTKVAPRPSIEKVKEYATIFGRAGGITSMVYIILVGDWSDAIGMFIGVIVTPIVGLIGAVGGSAGGALLATILHYIEFSNFDKEYKLSDDSWKIQIQT